MNRKCEQRQSKEDMNKDFSSEHTRGTSNVSTEDRLILPGTASMHQESDDVSETTENLQALVPYESSTGEHYSEFTEELQALVPHESATTPDYSRLLASQPSGSGSLETVGEHLCMVPETEQGSNFNPQTTNEFEDTLNYDASVPLLRHESPQPSEASQEEFSARMKKSQGSAFLPRTTDELERMMNHDGPLTPQYDSLTTVQRLETSQEESQGNAIVPRTTDASLYAAQGLEITQKESSVDIVSYQGDAIVPKTVEESTMAQLQHGIPPIDHGLEVTKKESLADIVSYDDSVPIQQHVGSSAVQGFKITPEESSDRIVSYQGDAITSKTVEEFSGNANSLVPRPASPLNSIESSGNNSRSLVVVSHSKTVAPYPEPYKTSEISKIVAHALETSEGLGNNDQDSAVETNEECMAIVPSSMNQNYSSIMSGTSNESHALVPHDSKMRPPPYRDHNLTKDSKEIVPKEAVIVSFGDKTNTSREEKANNESTEYPLVMMPVSVLKGATERKESTAPDMSSTYGDWKNYEEKTITSNLTDEVSSSRRSGHVDQKFSGYSSTCGNTTMRVARYQDENVHGNDDISLTTEDLYSFREEKEHSHQQAQPEMSKEYRSKENVSHSTDPINIQTMHTKDSMDSKSNTWSRGDVEEEKDSFYPMPDDHDDSSTINTYGTSYMNSENNQVKDDYAFKPQPETIYEDEEEDMSEKGPEKPFSKPSFSVASKSFDDDSWTKSGRSLSNRSGFRSVSGSGRSFMSSGQSVMSSGQSVMSSGQSVLSTVSSQHSKVGSTNGLRIVQRPSNNLITRRADSREVEVSMDGFMHQAKSFKAGENALSAMASISGGFDSYLTPPGGFGSYPTPPAGNDTEKKASPLRLYTTLLSVVSLLVTVLFFTAHIGPFIVDPNIRNGSRIVTTETSTQKEVVNVDNDPSSISSALAVDDLKDSKEVWEVAVDGDKMMVVAIPPWMREVFLDKERQYLGASSELPFIWAISKSGGDVVSDTMSHCLSKVIAGDGKRYDHTKYHFTEFLSKELKKLTGQDGHTYVNVDLFSLEGIDRAATLKLTQRQISDLLFTPFLRNSAENLFAAENGESHPKVAARFLIIARDPVERALNIFEATREFTGNNDLTLQQFAVDPIFAENNPLTRGILGISRDDILGPKQMQIAQEILFKYAFVGLYNKIETSIDRYERFFNWSPNTYDPNIVLCREKVRSSLESGHRVTGLYQTTDPIGFNALAANYEKDQQLYKYIQELFDLQGTITPAL